MTDGRDYRVQDNDTSQYVGVDPEYMTYANKTEQPLNTAEEQWDLGLLDHLEGNMDEVENTETEGSEVDIDETKTDPEADPEVDPETETPVTQPSHNPPTTVPGVFTPTVQ
jgi:hypothetical protein